MLAVGNARIQFSSAVKLLGVHLKFDLSLEKQVFLHCQSLFVFFNLRSISSLLTAHTRSPANALTVFLILSQLDYCNSLLVGVPQMQIKRLQAVQNAAATATVRQTKHDHTTDTLREIHWLAVCDPSLHKLLSVTYHSVHKKLPLYFSNLILPYIPSRSLRSAINSFLAVPEPKDCKTK